jgi:nicotinamidase/pyrazinamidase
MMARIKTMLRNSDALIIVDVQKDFCPGGALPIKDGDKVVPILNDWIGAAVSRGVAVYASRDWHPVGHISFKGSGGRWPPHCIQDSNGALFHPNLRLPDSVIKITKGVRFDQDQNSAFDQTGLSGHLHKNGIQRLWIGGLAEDVCVLATVLDACEDGFEVILISDATRPVTVQGGEKARQEMQDAGASFISHRDLFSEAK